MNLAMGAKLLWRLISRKDEWWKRILLRKYLEGSHLISSNHFLINWLGSYIQTSSEISSNPSRYDHLYLKEWKEDQLMERQYNGETTPSKLPWTGSNHTMASI